jgi:hypothetical protein
VAQVSGEVRKWRCFEFDGSNDTSLKKVTLKTKLLSIDEDDAKTNGELVIETFLTWILRILACLLMCERLLLAMIDAQRRGS